jgi:hypothetical protein
MISSNYYNIKIRMIATLDYRKKTTGYVIILPFLTILLLLQVVTPACVFGEINPPPSSQQYVNNEYYL